jgi:dihydroorotase
VHALTQGPADVLQQGIDPAEGATAELTLFNPTLEWTFAPHDVPYGYANTPLMGKRLTGKALGIIGNGQFRWFGS